MIPLHQFLDWSLTHMNTLEFEGSDEGVSLLNRVVHLYAEYTSDYIDTAEFLHALRTDPLVHKTLVEHKVAIA